MSDAPSLDRAYLERADVAAPSRERAGGDRARADRRRPTRCRARRPRPPARPGAAARPRPAGARCPTASATSRCAPRCPASPPRWSTGGSTGTRDDPVRYRIWHPRGALRATRSSVPPRRGARPHWGDCPSPGRGRRHGHASTPGSPSSPPSELGFSERRARRSARGDDRLRLGRRRPPARAAHADGPRLPRRTATASSSAAASGSAPRCARTCRRPSPRRPRALLDNRLRAPPRAAARRCRARSPRHCAEEYANLAALLPELRRRFG